MIPKHWTIPGTTCTISGSQLPYLICLLLVMLQRTHHESLLCYSYPDNCLNNVSLDPLQYGFRMEEGNLEAELFHSPLLDHMATNCNEVCYFTMPLQRGELTYQPSCNLLPNYYYDYVLIRLTVKCHTCIRIGYHHKVIIIFENCFI